ncbi:MAG: ABC transporter permease subunit [Intestinimonas sp.]
MAAICITVIVLLINSSYGRAFKAIREDEIAAEAMGINLFRHKQLSFCISSFFRRHRRGAAGHVYRAPWPPHGSNPRSPTGSCSSWSSAASAPSPEAVWPRFPLRLLPGEWWLRFLDGEIIWKTALRSPSCATGGCCSRKGRK